MFMLVLGNHTSIFPQPVLAQAGIEMDGAAPKVPDLPLYTLKDVGFGPGTTLKSDGIACKGCELMNGAVIKYSGGSFSFEASKLSGLFNIVLDGPAKNTAVFLASFGLLGCPKQEPKTPHINPNAPAMRTANLEPATFNLASPSIKR